MISDKCIPLTDLSVYLDVDLFKTVYIRWVCVGEGVGVGGGMMAVCFGILLCLFVCLFVCLVDWLVGWLVDVWFSFYFYFCGFFVLFFVRLFLVCFYLFDCFLLFCLFGWLLSSSRHHCHYGSYLNCSSPKLAQSAGKNKNKF